MSTSELDRPDLIADVECTASDLVVSLKDGRTIAAPLWWYPRLLRATPDQRARFEIGRFGIHWPDIDEDIELAGLFLGAKAPGARRPRSNEIDPQVRAHADLWRAIQAHNGRAIPLRYDDTQMACYKGRVVTDAGLCAGLIDIEAEFAMPAMVVAFIVSAKHVIVKWLELRKDRTIAIRRGDTDVLIKGSNDVDKAIATFKELEGRADKP